MTWAKLRPKLRGQFGNYFSFYNDKYRSGKRRIKISTAYPQDMITYVKQISPELDIKQWNTYSITIHYNK